MKLEKVVGLVLLFILLIVGIIGIIGFFMTYMWHCLFFAVASASLIWAWYSEEYQS